MSGRAVLWRKRHWAKKWGEIPMLARLFRPFCRIGICGDNRAASDAPISRFVICVCAGGLEKRLLALRVAIWAKPMRWFVAACILFQHVGDHTSGQGLKLISLFFS